MNISYINVRVMGPGHRYIALSGVATAAGRRHIEKTRERDNEWSGG
jgi:hypothetical protein